MPAAVGNHVPVQSTLKQLSKMLNMLGEHVYIVMNRGGGGGGGGGGFQISEVIIIAVMQSLISTISYRTLCMFHNIIMI